MVQPVRIGVVGIGRWGEVHARTLSQLSEVELGGLWDMDAARTDAVARELGCGQYPDLDRLLADVEAVVVATPDSVHRPACVAAARAGRHILLEKPIATNVDDARAIIAAAEKAGVQLAVGHILRFEPRYHGLWQAVRAGDLGEPVYVNVQRANLLEHGRRRASDTDVDFFLAIHDFDIAQWIVGSPITEVFARGVQKIYADTSAHDCIVFSLAFQNGAIGQVLCAWSMPDGSGSSLDAFFHFVGTGGSASITLRGTGFRVTRAYDAWPDPYDVSVLGQSAGPLATELRHFARTVRQGLEPAASGREALCALLAIEAGRRSLSTGRPESVRATAGEEAPAGHGQ